VAAAKLTRAFLRAAGYPASDELRNFPKETLMLVSCWSRSPVDSTVSRMRWGPLAIALAALLLARPARPAPRSMHFRPIHAWSAAEMCWSRSMRRAEDASISIDLNGHDITGEFRRESANRCTDRPGRRSTIGENTLSVSGRECKPTAWLLTNYPITGPITSGPHIKPFICQAQEFVLPDGTSSVRRSMPIVPRRPSSSTCICRLAQTR